MSNALVNLPDAQSYDVSSLPAFIAGGDCLPLELQHRFRQLFGVHPDEVCGMTEIMRCTARACIPATWRGAARRRRLPLVRGSHEGHHHPWWLEYLAGRSVCGVEAGRTGDRGGLDQLDRK
jgi:acyl-CoA synthetase (AMP-forming)/AMP-acid ligase II